MLRRRARPRPEPEYTGPDLDTQLRVQARFGGRCARCGRDGVYIHHRRARGMGGTKRPEINLPSNLLFLCGTGTTFCHGWIEHNRAEARVNGWLLRSGDDPCKVAVLLWDGRRVLLDDDGGWVCVRDAS